MEGIVFYDESSGFVTLKSTIEDVGNVKMQRLDENTIGALRIISKLDKEGSDYPIYDEHTMRFIDSVCKSKNGRVPKGDFTFWYREYKDFVDLVLTKWNALRDSSDILSPEYFNCEEKGFFLIPFEEFVLCIDQLKSMVRLWDFIHKNSCGRRNNFHTVMNTKHIKVFDDTDYKLLHILYPLHGEGDVILTRLNGKNVQTFELMVGNDRYFVISMESPSENTTVKFLNFLEWGIDKAYDMLFREKKHKSSSSVVLNLKIKK